MAIESTYINTVVKKAAGITSAALLGLSCYYRFLLRRAPSQVRLFWSRVSALVVSYRQTAQTWI